MSWISHALGGTDKNQLFLEMTPRLLAGFGTELRQIKQGNHSTDPTRFQYLRATEAHMKTLQTYKEIESGIISSAANDGRPIDHIDETLGRQQSQLSPDLVSELDDYNKLEAMLRLINKYEPWMPPNPGHLFSGKAEENAVRSVIQSEKMLLMLKERVDSGQPLPTGLYKERVDFWINVVKAYKPLLFPNQ